MVRDDDVHTCSVVLSCVLSSIPTLRGRGARDEDIEDWDNQGDGLGMHIVPEEV